MKHKFIIIILIFSLLFSLEKAKAQDLDPRAYLRTPVRVSILGFGYGYTYGSVVTDPTLPIKDVDAKIQTLSLVVLHTFSMFHQSAQVSANLPYSWADVTGSVLETAQHVSRAGLGDMRLRLSVLVHGAPAGTAAELAKSPRRTILGTSLSITVPTGQYIYGKLINLGTNRWSFKPELALSQPIGERWLFDLYAGIWFFTANNSFYPGSSVRKQDPMGSFQAHMSYNVTPRLWAALNFTYYTGGASTIDGLVKDDRADNVRVGSMVVFPVGKRSSIRVAYSTGAIIRFGANFSTISVACQSIFLGKPRKTVPIS